MGKAHLRRPSDYVLLTKARNCLSRLQQGEAVPTELVDAFDEFFNHCDPLMRRFAVSCHTAQDQVDDVVQNAWLKIVRAFPSFECRPDRGRFHAWLHVQVRNVAVDHFRRALPEVSTGINFENMPSTELEPHMVIEQRWNDAVLEQALDMLQLQVGELNCKLFVMSRFHRLTVEELSADTGLKREMVRWRIFRTKKAFQGLWENEGFSQLVFPDFCV